MQLICQIELQRGCRPWRKVPEETDKNRWINRPVFQQPLDIPQEIQSSRLRLVIGIAEDRVGFPETQEGYE